MDAYSVVVVLLMIIKKEAKFCKTSSSGFCTVLIKGKITRSIQVFVIHAYANSLFAVISVVATLIKMYKIILNVFTS